MTQEEKELLIKDLCSRLPYGVKVDAYSYSTPQTLYSIDVFMGEYTLENGDSGNLFVGFDKPIFSNIKPYLRPMASMTEEEEKEFQEIKLSYHFDEDSYILLDWLNKKMFDYRGLIEKGLALEASKGMYGIKHTKSEQEQIEELAELKEKLNK